jgi:hypothetical protein
MDIADKNRQHDVFGFFFTWGYYYFSAGTFTLPKTSARPVLSKLTG